MKPEQFVTEQAIREEIQLQIFDVLDDVGLDLALVIVRIEREVPKMSTINMRKTLANLQALNRQNQGD
ncbi:hypothetical protein LCGC14_2670030 [marine sediment metagenome]|uniref:Uncharacterized protein n=1 Tax=marine sediment metagenome TaxID=412755 RepID=A0A0F8ZPB9_9ZZZZ